MKFNIKDYNPYREFELNGNKVYVYFDDTYECAVVVDKDNNILSDSKTGGCACQTCREGV